MLHRSIFRLALMLSALGVSSCGIPARSAAVPQPASSQAHRAAARVPSGRTSGPVDVAPSHTVVGQDHLYIRQDAGSAEDRVMVIDSADGTAERELPVGLLAPDWSV
ncbi:MAG TPA: hypothetical protein VEZ12_11835, partial [Herpetosiphonaceae bacterium]|nr:hypothetical protein [Herpetosiphonaceae bacterium]